MRALENACDPEVRHPGALDDGSDATFSGRTIGRVEIVEAAGRPLRLITDGRGHPGQLTALVQFCGTASVHQADRTAILSDGDLCLVRGSRPLTLEQDACFESILVSVPEKEIAARFPLWRAALLTPIDSGSGVPAVFREAVLSLKRWSGSLGDAGSEGLADAVLDLMGAVICCAVPINSDCVRRSFYHQDRIKTFARLNLANPELSIELIAEAVGLSPRQIHRLFANEELSLMRWIWVQRLEQCYRELIQDGSAQRSISEIAYAWGFNDQAHFSRTFRKHFGVSPRSLRRRSGHPSVSLS
ncbi:helix-turn-helix domain-containing protein [Thiocapsa rosea]|uniref:helix-turn-helix domain-containing protein n=1 Tax=Thiocapsa rosea TaxID=69360 RepID=UPI001FE6897B|nr:helix-turn-helix domain-containing protein [Thiocapsa rosea]